MDDATVELAIALIDASGVATRAEERLATTTGRPRSISVQAVLVGLVCLAMDDRPLLLTSVTELIYRRLSEAARRRLEITGTASDHKSFLARYRCVRYCFHALCSTVDPSALPKNRRLSDEELAKATKEMSAAEAEAARGRLEALVNAVVQASLSVLSESERCGFDGSLGLDATAMALYSRGPARRAGLCASDPDGGWYVREGDHRDAPDPRTGRTRTKIAWALEATIATSARTPGVAPSFPNLVLGACLSRPGADPGGTGARVLASVRSRGHRPGYLGADRAYSAALPERFHLPARALGYSLVMDYRVDQLAVQANSGGALLVEGTWCCPAMPGPLVSATEDHREGEIDTTTYQTRISARAAYRLKRKAGPDHDGYERLACPASGVHPGLICPLRPASSSPCDGRTKVGAPPEEPPRVCRQDSITIAPDVGARHRQSLPFATEAWARRYATLRNTIEGLNGFAKDPAHEALGEPARRRVRGIAAQSIFCALLLLAVNLRKIRGFRALIAEGGAEAVAARARRRRTRLGDYAPDH